MITLKISKGPGGYSPVSCHYQCCVIVSALPSVWPSQQFPRPALQTLIDGVLVGTDKNSCSTTTIQPCVLSRNLCTSFNSKRNQTGVSTRYVTLYLTEDMRKENHIKDMGLFMFFTLCGMLTLKNNNFMILKSPWVVCRTTMHAA